MDGIIDSLREGLGINSSTQSVTTNSRANNLSRNNSAANNSTENNLSRNNSAANNLSRNNSAANNTATRISVSRRNRDTLPSLKKTVPVGSALLSKPLKNSTMTGGSRRRRRRTRKNKYRVIR